MPRRRVRPVTEDDVDQHAEGLREASAVSATS